MKQFKEILASIDTKVNPKSALDINERVSKNVLVHDLLNYAYIQCSAIKAESLMFNMSALNKLLDDTIMITNGKLEASKNRLLLLQEPNINSMLSKQLISIPLETLDKAAIMAKYADSKYADFVNEFCSSVDEYFKSYRTIVKRG